MITGVLQALHFDLGTFAGFSFRDQCAIEHSLTADEVVNWNHDTQGEAEFWPSGDHEGVALVFKDESRVTGAELLELDELLNNLGGAEDEYFLRIYFHVSNYGMVVGDLGVGRVEDEPMSFFGDCFYDVRKAAAFELFELYYPELFKMYDTSTCDGLIFDTDVFLDSPSFCTEELTFGGRAVLLVSPR